jgi:hypothetical protein
MSAKRDGAPASTRVVKRVIRIRGSFFTGIKKMPFLIVLWQG